MLRAAISVIVLFAFWTVLSGFFTPFLLAAGLASSIAVVWFSRRMTLVDREGLPMHLLVPALWYWPWLLNEIGKSALDVARVILHPRLPIAPELVRVPPGQRTTVGLCTHANSITLTPGTITVEAGPDEFLVHALTAEGAQGVRSGDMDRRVTRFEGGG